MDWTANFEALMAQQGLPPYACLVNGCEHVSRTTFGQVLHYLFGTHQ